MFSDDERSRDSEGTRPEKFTGFTVADKHGFVTNLNMHHFVHERMRLNLNCLNWSVKAKKCIFAIQFL